MYRMTAQVPLQTAPSISPIGYFVAIWYQNKTWSLDETKKKAAKLNAAEWKRNIICRIYIPESPWPFLHADPSTKQQADEHNLRLLSLIHGRRSGGSVAGPDVLVCATATAHRPRRMQTRTDSYQMIRSTARAG
jgi:hypothetical protein